MMRKSDTYNSFYELVHPGDRKDVRLKASRKTDWAVKSRLPKQQAMSMGENRICRGTIWNEILTRQQEIKFKS